MSAIFFCCSENTGDKNTRLKEYSIESPSGLNAAIVQSNSSTGNFEYDRCFMTNTRGLRKIFKEVLKTGGKEYIPPQFAFLRKNGEYEVIYRAYISGKKLGVFFIILGGKKPDKNKSAVFIAEGGAIKKIWRIKDIELSSFKLYIKTKPEDDAQEKNNVFFYMQRIPESDTGPDDFISHYRIYRKILEESG
ncbi:MAG: hypothetical protein ACLFQK_03555 [Fibrobacterota bacterium]